jgi:glutaminase
MTTKKIKKNSLNKKKSLKKIRKNRIQSINKKLNLQEIIEKIYNKLKGRYQNAKNADYIPILKDMDPNIFQISVYPIKNNSYGFESKHYNVGDFIDKNGDKIEVTIQSVSKVFNLALAIKKRNRINKKKKINKTGLDDMLELIGTEESFMGFNDIKAHRILNGKQGVPFTINPFINAGAIATVSFITPTKNKSTYHQLIDNMNIFSGHNRKRHYISVSTFHNEMKWLKNNTLLARKIKSLSEKYYNEKTKVRKFKYFQGNNETLGIKSSLSNYTTMCSVLVDTNELADMTYTLANKGINSVGERILSCEENRYILSALIFGGMYNASGQWFQKLGIPMKSGVGGAIIGIIPGELAISVISPPLDKYGNSFLGGQVMLQLANELKFHSKGFCKYEKLQIPSKPKNIKKIKEVHLIKETNLKKIEDIVEKRKKIL